MCCSLSRSGSSRIRQAIARGVGAHGAQGHQDQDLGASRTQELDLDRRLDSGVAGDLPKDVGLARGIPRVWCQHHPSQVLLTTPTILTRCLPSVISLSVSSLSPSRQRRPRRHRTTATNNTLAIRLHHHHHHYAPQVNANAIVQRSRVSSVLRSQLHSFTHSLLIYSPIDRLINAPIRPRRRWFALHWDRRPAPCSR